MAGAGLIMVKSAELTALIQEGVTMALMTPFIDLYRVASGNPPSETSKGFFERLGSGIAMGWRAAIRYRKFARMSDEALAKQGLTREQIARHSFFGNEDGRS